MSDTYQYFKQRRAAGWSPFQVMLAAPPRPQESISHRSHWLISVEWLDPQSESKSLGIILDTMVLTGKLSREAGDPECLYKTLNK